MLRRKRIFWHLFVSYLLIAIVVLVAVFLLLFFSFKGFYSEQIMLLKLDHEIRVSIQTVLLYIYEDLYYYCILILFLISVLCLYLSSNFNKPLQILKQRAEKFALGDFSAKVKLDDYVCLELDQLGRAINKMAVQLNQRFKTIFEQKKLQEVVFAGMVEGVITVNGEGKIIQLNQSAIKLLQIETDDDPVGKLVIQVIKNPIVHKLINGYLFFNETLEKEIVLDDEKETLLYVHGTTLRDSHDKKIGALFVFSDVSHLKEMENNQREFVANVSHELKTPLTSIKGFVETLMDNKIDEEDRVRFLQIVLKQVNKINSLIRNMFTLSRINEKNMRSQILFSNYRLIDIINRAVSVCNKKAISKNINLKVKFPSNSTHMVNDSLIEMALTNLIDNAIKYSNDNTSVYIDSVDNDQRVLVSVRDEGPGIEKEHLSKLFDRFYRIDKARSRKLGGTGLGLSIVKQIAEVHLGKVEVLSTVNNGSTFTLNLPK